MGQLTPSGAHARVAANLAALRLSRQLAKENRPADGAELAALAGFSSWGAVPGMFDESNTEWASARTELRALLDQRAWAAAARTTINAHYTDPAIAAVMWRAAADLGLAGGHVLEPGCGTGLFVGLAPRAVSMVGVELDPATAAIAQSLYPDASIRCESFADTAFPDGSFDAAIGNVPFANVVLHDPSHNRRKLSIHNHFIVKSLDLIRPGGIAMFLTSAFTLDAANPTARHAMHERADLIGAVRLPTGAHRRAAGTDALMDLIILRRRPAGQPPGDDAWTRTVPLSIDGVDTGRRINAYLAQRPKQILGAVRLAQGMYGPNTLQVVPDSLTDTPAALSAVLDRIVTAARQAGLTHTPTAGPAPAPVAAAPDISATVGTIEGDQVRGFTQRTLDGVTTLPVPKAHRAELAALLALRDTARAVLTMEAASPTDSDELSRSRASLAGQYRGYVARYGPINRVTKIVTNRIDEDTGENIVAHRRPPAARWLKTDPWASLLRALELYDEATGSAAPAAIQTERVVIPRTPPAGVDTPDEAVAVALDIDGQIRLDRVAGLLGVTPAEARTRLGTLVFDDPADGRLVPAPEYLSGNVRSKLDAARTAAATDDRYRCRRSRNSLPGRSRNSLVARGVVLSRSGCCVYGAGGDHLLDLACEVLGGRAAESGGDGCVAGAAA